MAERLVNDYLEIQLKELEDIINDKYPKYANKDKKERKEKKSKEVVQLEKEIDRLKKMLNENKKEKSEEKSEKKKEKKDTKKKKSQKKNSKKTEESFINYVYSVDSDVKRIGKYEASLHDDFNQRVKKNCEKKKVFFKNS